MTLRHTRRSSRLRLLTAVIAATMVVAACGSDKKASPETTAAAPADTTAGTEAAAPADTTADATANTTAGTEAAAPATEAPADSAPAATEAAPADTKAAPADSKAADAGSVDGGVAPAKLAELKAAVAEAEKLPTFAAQGPAFSVKSLAGKKILSMPVASSLKGCDDMSKWVVDIAKSVGMTDSTYFQNDGGPAAWQQGMEQAINGNYDGVALVCGIDPNALKPQMEAAKAKGMKVVDLHLADVSVAADPLIAGQTNGEFNRSMKMGVYAALVASGGKPINVFVITSNENPPSIGMEKTVKDTFAELCSKCKVTSQNVPIPDWFGGKGQTTIDSALVGDKDLAAVFTVYDFMAPIVIGSIKSHSSKAKIYAFGGDTPTVATMNEPDSPLSTDMGPGYLWMAYSGADQLFRALADQPVISADKAYAPYRLWSPNNAKEKPTDEGFGKAFIDGYRALWLDAPKA
jgi:ribose transport system substrate-binding protein